MSWQSGGLLSCSRSPHRGRGSFSSRGVTTRNSFTTANCGVFITKPTGLLTDCLTNKLIKASGLLLSLLSIHLSVLFLFQYTVYVHLVFILCIHTRYVHSMCQRFSFHSSFCTYTCTLWHVHNIWSWLYNKEMYSRAVAVRRHLMAQICDFFNYFFVL